MAEKRCSSLSPSATPRALIQAAIAEAPASARELSQRLRLSERDVTYHLEQLARSAKGRGQRLLIEPSACLGCGFVFEQRERTKKPGSCPRCKSTRITAPRFGWEQEP